MSIVFKPTIPESFDSLKNIPPVVIAVKPKSPKALREYNPFSAKEISLMVNLRAIGVPYKEIARLLHRSSCACSNTLSRYDLKNTYQAIRANLIDDIMQEGAMAE